LKKEVYSPVKEPMFYSAGSAKHLFGFPFKDIALVPEKLASVG